MLLPQMLEQFENIGAAERLGPISSMMLISLWRKSSKIGNPLVFNTSYRELSNLSGVTKPNDFTLSLNRLVHFGYIKYSYDKMEYIKIELNPNIYVPFEAPKLDKDKKAQYDNVLDALEQQYILLRGQGFFVSPIDYDEMRIIAETTNITVEQAVEWLNECFEQYTPRFRNDSIRSFKYCSLYIFRKLTSENAKKGIGENYGVNEKHTQPNAATDARSEYTESIDNRRTELRSQGFFKKVGKVEFDF